ncbi:hypothetical protein ACFE04_007631 [Oxalis oulophora]
MSQNLLIIIVSILLLLQSSLHSTSIVIVDASSIVEKVSGSDQDDNEALFIQKFTALLGINNNFNRRRRSHLSHQYNNNVSPSSSPTPAHAPAPAHAHVHFHGHSHPAPPRQHSHLSPEAPHPNNGGDIRKSSSGRVLIPVVVSVTGVMFAFCVSVVVFCLCKKNRKESNKTVSFYSQKDRRTRSKSRNMNSQNSSTSTSKVSLNPGLDLFYLSALELDLEHQQEQSDNAISPENNDHRIIEKEAENQECVKSEIVSVDEDVVCESGDMIIPIQCNSSLSDNDDESFHSFNDSHSNASPLSPLNIHNEGIKVNCTSPDCQKSFTFTPPTPPPPPPPPPPHMASRRKILVTNPKSTYSPWSSTLPTLSPLRNSVSSVETDQSPARQLCSSPGSIPSPPCPPQHTPKENGGTSHGGTPPPPCPPPCPPQNTPEENGGASLPKLKPLHWDKVRAAPDRTMVWDKLRASSFEFDEEMIESLFGYNIMKNDETKSKSPSPTKHVLEPKRLQNITILSKALNASCEQVCNALMKGEGLCLQQLEALAKMVPTKEEEGKLCSYKGDIDKLGSAERFLKALLGIPFAFERVEAMLYKETFEDETVHLRNSFSMLEEACKELRSNRLFLKLLEAVLKTGNRMNVGTVRGGAKAFKLDALLKLADVKGTDGKTSLLHFVVQEIIRSEGIRVSDSIMGQINQRGGKTNKTAEDKEEDYKRMGLDLVSGLSTEFYNVKKTATIDIDVLGSSVSNLSDEMAKIKHLVQKELTDGNFTQSMKCFINYAERNLRQLKEDERRVLSNVKEITEYFHGNVSKEEANPLRIFVIVRDFLAMLDHVCKELRSFKAPNSPNPLAPFL